MEAPALLPLTLLSGIYGMTIIVHPHTEPLDLVVVPLSMVVVAAGVLWWARSSGLVVAPEATSG